MNDIKPIWQRPSKEVDDDEYKAFYKSFSKVNISECDRHYSVKNVFENNFVAISTQLVSFLILYVLCFTFKKFTLRRHLEAPPDCHGVCVTKQI